MFSQHLGIKQCKYYMIWFDIDIFLFIPLQDIWNYCQNIPDGARQQLIIGLGKIEQHNPDQIVSNLAAEIIILQRNNMWTRAIHQFRQEMVILNPCLTRERIGSVNTYMMYSLSTPIWYTTRLNYASCYARFPNFDLQKYIHPTGYIHFTWKILWYDRFQHFRFHVNYSL